MIPETRFHSWEGDLQKSIRRFASFLMFAVPIVMALLIHSRFAATGVPRADWPKLRVWLTIISGTGAVSFFFPWNRLSASAFLVMIFLASFYLSIVVKMTGGHASPFFEVFYMIPIITFFYFQGWPLYLGLAGMIAGYLYSVFHNAPSEFDRSYFIVDAFSFASVCVVVYFLDRRARKYQRLATSFYEDLLRHKELLHKAEQPETMFATIGGISHRLSQPLTVALLRVELALEALRASPLSPQELRKIHDELTLAKELLRQFSELGEYVTESYVSGAKILTLKEDFRLRDRENS